ncbi:hypothetical protein EBU94_06530, partial [bacterium]|nr:hypothetical protein [bacterium]
FIYIKNNRMEKNKRVMITKYEEYIVESYLRTSQRLLELLVNVDDPIAKKFWDLIDRDIKTQYNGLDYLDKENEKGKVSFLTDSQFTNKLKTTDDYNSLISDKNNSSSIGKIVRSILKDNGINFTDSEIETFVNKFKSKVGKSEIKIVKGEDIRYWYLESNYYLPKKGCTLWNSCMRHKSCQDYLDIYVKNENVSLVIMTKEGKLVARALLWENVEKNYRGSYTYLDRIYYYSDDYEYSLYDWCMEEFDNLLSERKGSHSLSVHLENNLFDHYPYMDTFRYSDDGGYFTTEDDDDNVYYTYDNTGGRRNERRQGCWSDIHGYSVDEDNAWYSSHYNDWLDVYSDSVIWSKSDEEYYLEDDCVDTEDKGWVLKDDAIKVKKLDGTYVFLTKKSDDYYVYDDEFYHIDYSVHTNDGEYIPPDKAISLVEISFSDPIYLDDMVVDFVKLFIKDEEHVDLNMVKHLDLDHFTNGTGYVSKEEYPKLSINNDNLDKCRDLLIKIYEKDIIDKPAFDYIMDQILNSYEEFGDNNRFGLEKLGKVWSSLLGKYYKDFMKNKDDYKTFE